MNQRIKDLILTRIFSIYPKKYVNAVVLFGSRARSDFYKDSDYDIKVYINCKIKNQKENMLDPKKNIYIDFDAPSDYRLLKNKGHPWIYCTFRDGIPLYQKNEWFDKNKIDVLKIKPTKEVIFFYLDACLRMLKMMLRRRFIYLDYEEGKRIANQLGFAILMNNNIYPISPHTLKKELVKLSPRYKKLAETIYYIQEVYYKCKKPQKSFYKNKIKILKAFTNRYVIKNFPDLGRNIY